MLRWQRRKWLSDDAVGAAVERPTAAQRDAGSMPARGKYLCCLQVVVPYLAVCVRVFSTLF